MAHDHDMLLAAKAWPFQEARAILDRLGGPDAAQAPEKGYVLFETGYGPSGLPHIGTFGEVARTTMVRQAFAQLSEIPTRLIAFSDDMDGLRAVPTNVPAQEMLRDHLGKPLTAEKAERLGLVNEIVDEAVDETALTLSLIPI